MQYDFNFTNEIVDELEEPFDDCPFKWEGKYTVARWNGKETDGSDWDFKRKGGELVRIKGAVPARDDPIMFGKHKGKLWPDIPHGYLVWLAENVKGSAKKRAKAEIQRRKR